MVEPNFFAGQTLVRSQMRSIAPWTLLFSGTKSIPSNAGSDTAVDTLVATITNSEIPYSVTGGVVTLTDGGIFLVSIVASFASNGDGTVRRAQVRVAGVNKLAPYGYPSPFTSGTGAHVSGAIPIQITAGQTVDVLIRQDSGIALSTTAYLGLTKLASLPA